MAQGGSFYSPGYDGSVIGPTGFTFTSLENGFSSAFAPPSSSSSGGGGFSGGGGVVAVEGAGVPGDGKDTGPWLALYEHRSMTP